MIPPNGHANDERVSADRAVAPNLVSTSHMLGRIALGEINRYTSELEAPFDPEVIEWRVTNTSQDKTRGQVIPYADQRAYTDRLNKVFTPAGWTRRYTIHTSANFERSKDQKIVAKVLVTCELIIFGLGSHSATGEEWADNDNAGTSAEAQAFKRASACFGLGRYLYYFDGVWVDLDQRKRPKSVPTLPKWATPTGWVEGLRPHTSMHPGTEVNSGASVTPSRNGSFVSEIERMAGPLGRGLYRGLLRDVARVWNPREIHDVSLQHKVLERMRSAERGLQRLQAVVERTGHGALIAILKSLGISQLERVDNLETLKRIVLELEDLAERQS